MASVEKRAGTPGRAKRTRNQQFFDNGVGRITGVTLKDTGIRDEHGLEPIDNIFSSPTSAEISVTGHDAHTQETPDGDHTGRLSVRKTPRIPLPRTSTPRHTNIGSPKRSSIRPSRLAEEGSASGSPQDAEEGAPNRVLDFSQNGIYKSIEKSPFKPRHNLRRSNGARRTGIFASPEIGRERQQAQQQMEDSGYSELGETGGTTLHDDDPPLMLGDESYSGPELHEIGENEASVEDEQHIIVQRMTETPISGASMDGSVARAHSGRTRSSLGKRNRANNNDSAIEPAETADSDGEHPSHRPKQRQSRELVADDEELDPAALDPALLAPLNEDGISGADESTVQVEAAQSKEPKRRGRKPKAKGVSSSKGPSARRSQGVTNEDSRKPRSNGRAGSAGPSSQFALRATTPHEDAGTFTRSGRPVVGPLQFWKGERYTWKAGVADGIIRADEIEEHPTKSRRGRKKGKKRKRNAASQRDEEDNDEETESLVPDDWERDVGVITGDVANWDPETQEGDPHDLIHEDLAHAESSLERSEVGGSSSFKFSKILTIPFFGAGVLELPPHGEKRVKNARKNQLAFFVHKGKVLVEVNPPGPDALPNQFTLTKGGVWIVPRGNDYSIANESGTTEAIIFFCQGSDASEVQEA